MKAVYIESHGGPDVLTYGNITEPEPGPNDVKIRVRASALNRLDIYTRAGTRGLKRSFPPPLILGGDTAGDIVKCGENVGKFVPGDHVVINPRVWCEKCDFCMAGKDDLCTKSTFMGTNFNGSYAEYVVIPAKNAHHVETDVDYKQAAATPTTFLPTWNLIVRKGQLKSSDTVLILSASSGVGSAAIQISKNVIGARIIATTSTDDKAQKALAIGADDVIVYPRESISKQVSDFTNGQGVDMVIDSTGAQFFPEAFQSLRIGGRYGICGVTTGYKGELHMGNLFTKNLTIFGAFMGSQSDMISIVNALNKRTIQPVVEHSFALHQAQDAHNLMESQNFFGKIVLVS